MGLRCSVLGHRYGERERHEERDERGDELIVAVREVKTCDRCGDELVVTESKEVRAIDQPEQTEPDPPEEPDHEEFAPIESFGTTDSTPEAPEMDDGIILPDEPIDRERGEWPADPMGDGQQLTRGGEPADNEEEWPETQGEDEGFDAVVGEVDEDIADDIIEAVSSESTSDDTEEGFFRAEPMDDPANPSETDVHAEYYCPRCDWGAKSLTTSVRRGDICPSCRRGYVAERESP